MAEDLLKIIKEHNLAILPTAEGQWCVCTVEEDFFLDPKNGIADGHLVNCVVASKLEEAIVEAYKSVLNKLSS